MKRLFAFVCAALLVAGSAWATQTAQTSTTTIGNTGVVRVILPAQAASGIDTSLVTIYNAGWVTMADTTASGGIRTLHALPIAVHANAGSNVDSCSVAIDVSPDGSGWTATGGLSATTFVKGTPQPLAFKPSSPYPLLRVRVTNSDSNASTVANGVWVLTITYPVAQ